MLRPEAAKVLPVQVDELGGLTVDYAIAISGASSGFNVAFDLWLTGVPHGNRNTITNEVMIWLHQGGYNFWQPRVGRFTSPDLSGDIHHTGTYTAIAAGSPDARRPRRRCPRSRRSRRWCRRRRAAAPPAADAGCAARRAGPRPRQSGRAAPAP